MITGGLRAATVTVALAVTDPAEFVAVSTNVVVWVTDTCVDPVAATLPTPALIETVVAPLVLHASVVWPPPAGNEFGVAVKLTMLSAGNDTVTVTSFVVVPPALVAVSLNVVVALTDVDFCESPVTSPTPLSIESVTPLPSTLQDSRVVPPPLGNVAGVAVKL